MNIDGAEIVKWVLGGTSLGGAFAVIRPFADRLFTHWITGREKREAERRDVDTRTLRALEHSVSVQERTIGVLERLDERMRRVDTRMDRIEGHLGITVSPSAVPPEPQPVDPRKSISGD